jgi:YVTN family beta-propeller protein
MFLAISLLPHGRKPALPAFTPNYKYLLVPNEETDNVSVVSLEELAVIHTIKLAPGSRPWQVKVLPSGDLAYVTNSRFAGTVETSVRDNSTVSVIDLRKGAVVKEIPVGAGPNGVTVDRLGRRGYVANMRSNTISVIDVTVHEVIATVPTGAAPAFAKLSRDLEGRLLAVTNLEDASVTVIDTDRLEVLKTLELGVPRLHDSFPEWGPGDTTGIAISVQDIAYITNYRSHTIVVVDLKDYSMNKLDSPIRFPFFVEIDQAMRTVIFSSGIAKSFAVFDMDSQEWLGVFPNDGSVFPDNEQMTSLNLWMTDPDNHRLTALLPRGLQGISENWERNMVTKFM